MQKPSTTVEGTLEIVDSTQAVHAFGSVRQHGAQYLPPELLDSIVRKLKRKDRKAFALVCRSWASVAYCRTFTSLTLSRVHKLESKLAVLGESTPLLRQSLIHLKLEFQFRETFDVDLLEDALPLFPLLKMLDLTVRGSETIGGARRSLRPTALDLESLAVNLHSIPPTIFEYLLGMFMNIKKFIVSQFSLSECPNAQDEMASHRPKVHTLLSRWALPTDVNWYYLLSMLDPASIVRIQIDHEYGSLGCVQASPRLENMKELVFKSRWSAGIVPLAQFPALSSFVFVMETDLSFVSLHEWNHGEIENAILHDFVDTICQAPAHIHDITLVLSYSVGDCIDMYNEIYAEITHLLAMLDWAPLVKAIETKHGRWSTMKIHIDTLLTAETRRHVKTRLDCAKLEEALRAQVTACFSLSQRSMNLLEFVVTENSWSDTGRKLD